MSSSNKSGYHHGNLRQTLIDAALSSIHQHGVEQLSLRALARDIGVSQSAPYRHFTDKLALLKAIAEEGSAKLAEQIRDAMGDIQADPVRAFKLGGQAYVRFAQQNPETYRLMYKMRAEGVLDSPGDNCDADAFALLEQTLDAGLADGSFKSYDKKAVVLTCWSMVHGYAQLVIDGILDLQDIPAEQAFQALSGVLHNGVFSSDQLA